MSDRTHWNCNVEFERYLEEYPKPPNDDLFIPYLVHFRIIVILGGGMDGLDEIQNSEKQLINTNQVCSILLCGFSKTNLNTFIF